MTTVVEEVRKLAETNKDELKRIVPLVDNHELLLRGDRKDRHDEGIVGLLNSFEKTNQMIRKALWGVGVPLVLAALSFAASQWWGMYVSYLAQQALNP